MDKSNDRIFKKTNKSLLVILILIIIIGLGFGIYKFYPRVDSVAIVLEEEDLEEGAELSLEKGDTLELKYYVFGNNTNIYSTKFTSSNPTVAIVDEKGLITAVDNGTTTIKVTIGGKSDEINITVYTEDNDVSMVVAAGGYTVYYNNTQIMDRLFIDANVSKQLVIKKGSKVVSNGITWAVKDTSYVTVTNGKVTAKNKVGETLVTAKIGTTTIKIPTVVEYANTSNIYYFDVQNSKTDDINQNAAVIKSRSGKYGMIDVGSNRKVVVSGSTIQSYYCKRTVNYLKDLGITELDFLIISHLHGDHYGCYAHIANNVKVKNLYIKEPDSVGDIVANNMTSKQKHFNEIVNKYKNKGTNIRIVTNKANYQIKYDDMEVYLGNRHIIFNSNAEYLKKCNKIVKYEGQMVSVGQCNENVESLVALIRFIGTSGNDSYNYIAGDVLNKGLKNVSGVSFKGKIIKHPFVRKSTESYASYYDKEKKKAKFYDRYNFVYSAEDLSACWARNIIARRKGIAEVSCTEATVKSKRNKIANSILDTSNQLKIDLYQVSHHGSNQSLVTYSYLKPTYAILSAGGGKGVKYYANTGTNEIIQKLIQVAGVNSTNIHYSGLGTVIYSVNAAGKMQTPIQLSDDD